MARKKKNVDVDELIEPMKDDAMNPPVEEDRAEEVGVVDDAIKENEEVVEPENDPINDPENEPVKSVESKKMRIKSTSSLVNVRETPEGNVLFRIQNGTPISVVEEKDGWCRIEGWVMKALVGER